ncbi:microtubule-associated tumor suppressor 1 homolog [Eurosta solidaginis]|uniref:microtubule-associated tumor suppressor 1 homolog n=1 Tax=Eurosta solidaginis TaxID=178769 RepID=UPI0035315ADA
MELPKFPKIEVNTNNDEVMENPLLEEFLKELLTHLKNDISRLNASCEKLKKSKEYLLASKDQHLRDIFTITHGRMPDSFLSQQLSQHMQTEIKQFRMGTQQVDGVLDNFQGDYIDWRRKLEEQVRNTLGGDEIFELSKPELEVKIETWRKKAENAKIELNAFEVATNNEHALLGDGIKILQAENNMLSSLKSEMGVIQQQLIDHLKENKLKSLEETNLALQEITALKKKLELYE